MTRFPVAAVLVALLAARPADATPSTLRNSRALYTNAIAAVAADHATRLAQTRETYAKAVESLIPTYRERGDPAPLLAAEKESLRFAQVGTVPSDLSASADLPHELKWARVIYLRGDLESQILRDRQLLALLEKEFGPSLETLMRQLVADGRGDEAQEAQAEINAVEAESTHLCRRIRDALPELWALWQRQVDLDHDAQLGAINATYATAMDKRIEQLNRDQAVDEVLSIMREKSRLNRDRFVPSIHDPNLLPAIRRARLEYHHAVLRAKTRRNRRTLQLLEQEYVPFVRQRLAELIDLGRTETSLQVGDELQAALSDEAYLRSRIPDEPTAPTALPPHLYGGLLLHYGFEPDDLDRIADLSGKRRHARPHGADWTPFGRSGAACTFDGSAWLGLADGGGLVSGSEPFTVCAWVRTDAGTPQNILQQRDPDAMDGEFELFVDSEGRVNYYEFSEGGFGMKLRTDAAVNDGRWHHVALVRAMPDSTILVDGIVDARHSGEVISISSDRTLAIGCDYGSEDSFFNGAMDEFMIYSRALSEDEIREIYGLFSRTDKRQATDQQD